MHPARNSHLLILSLAATGLLTAMPTLSAPILDGQVLGGGAPIANSTVTLWAAGDRAPKLLGQARSGADGRFTIPAHATVAGSSLYLVAQGGEPTANKSVGNNTAIALMAVLGNKPPARVTINEMTTVASVWTHNQFLDGSALSGPPLSLGIAAGNVPNFVDPQTGGYGSMIQSDLNSSQTPTMANFATLSSVLAGCVSRIKADACESLFAAATGRDGKVPANTLAAAHSIARDAGYRPERIFALLDAFYPVPNGKKLRSIPYLPYLSVAPSAWILPLKFAGGGYVGGAKVLFDSQGNAWSGANFIVGSQGGDALWDGNLAKFSPNGKPLSPMTTGFAGGGLLGPGFGTAIDANDRVWITSTSGKTVSLFDKSGKPLSPPEGYNFGGKLSTMQGIIVAPNGDVWAVDFGDDKVIYLPKGDPSKVQFFCQSTDGKPNKDSPCQLSGPFHMVIDQQDRIWIDNAIGDTVTRFPASDPSKVEVFKTGGHSGKGMAVDSGGNVWVTNTLGSGMTLETKLRLLALKLTGAPLPAIDRELLKDLLGHPGLGNVSLLRPDGTPVAGSPFNPTGSIWGAWAVSIDGNDHAWVSNFAPGGGITQLCGARTETCPPGMKTGDAISPSGGWKGGGMQMLVDVSIDPAGNVWVSNNWQDPAACYAKSDESHSTRCGGQGMTVFFGMAKPVRAPQIGPARPL
ncbi:MAG: Streptogramin lyase [Candidatus Accumulibacter sp. SK-11]|nr:MAG: Streptogramin lyase [Candidatus Accumulibacter sp. SK-11]